MAEPSDEQLRAFVNAVLAELDESLREPEVIEESIGKHREMWLVLYRASHGLETPDS